jgi:CMP-N-acetylneuraminic acid synthetase
LRTPEDIEGCLDLFQSTEADCVISVLTVPDTYNPHWVYFLRADGSLRLSTGEAAPIPRRQELPPAYHREGSVYVSRSSVVLEQNSLYGKKVLGYSMDPARSVNIDDFNDWLRAEKLLEVRTC